MAKRHVGRIAKPRGIRQEEAGRRRSKTSRPDHRLAGKRAIQSSILLAFKIARYFNVSIEEIFIYGGVDMKKHGLQTALGILGLALLALGLYLVKTTNATEGILLTLPYVFVGIGSGLFGQGMGGVIERRVLKKNPEILKQKEIEVNDERNQQISNRAKAKAYDVMVFVFGALMVAFALMGMDIVAVLLLVFAYLFVVGSAVYYRVKFEKEL
jgi:hypothetical protein